MTPIPVFKPSYGPEELEALKQPFESGWIGLGPKTRVFEEKFAAYAGTAYASAMNSCTAALHLAFHALGIEGKEVITTPMTFVSTNHAILYNRGIPVFCDIEPDTMNLDAAKLEPLVTRKTAAIVVVHYGGHACDMDAVMAIAAKHKLPVVEDCAHAAGGEYKGKKLGSIGVMGCFSFHAVKNMSTGEGGMVTTNDEALYQRVKQLRWMGISTDTFAREDQKTKNYSWYYDVRELGYKYHMSDIAASLGLVQLKKLDAMNERRAAIARRYDEELGDCSWLTTPVVKDYTRCARHNYVIKTPHRDALNEFLKTKGIASGVHYIPNNHYEMYRAYGGSTPVSDAVWKRILTLPLYPDLTDTQVSMIVGAIHEFGKSLPAAKKTAAYTGRS